MKNMSKIWAATSLSLTLLLSACFAIENGEGFQQIAPGGWRAVFMFGEGEDAERIPVLFKSLSSKEVEKPRLLFYNGQDSNYADSLRFWGDTLFVYFEGTKNYLQLIREVDLMEGNYMVKGAAAKGADLPIKLYAKFSRPHRFKDLHMSPDYDINGNWALDILDKDENLIPGQLRLKTDKNTVYAELKSGITEKPIYLEGTIQKDQLRLSAFTGKELVYIAADLRDATTLGRAKIRYNQFEYACSAKKIKN